MYAGILCDNLVLYQHNHASVLCWLMQALNSECDTRMSGPKFLVILNKWSEMVGERV